MPPASTLGVVPVMLASIDTSLGSLRTLLSSTTCLRLRRGHWLCPASVGLLLIDIEKGHRPSVKSPYAP